MSYTIYTLRDPRDDEVRYIGATELPLFMRLKHHVGDVNSSNKKSPRVQWLRELVRDGLVPVIEEVDSIETVNPSEAGEREDDWIKLYRKQGYNLLNVRRGGAGLYPRDGLSEWALERLGTMPDTRIAEHEGKSGATIGYWRRKLDIPVFEDRSSARGKTRDDWKVYSLRMPSELLYKLEVMAYVTDRTMADIARNGTLAMIQELGTCDPGLLEAARISLGGEEAP